MEGADDLPVASNYQQIVRTHQLGKMMSMMAPHLRQTAEWSEVGTLIPLEPL